MTWRDTLRPASFRGVSFSVSRTDDDAGGRRVAVYEAPGVDTPTIDDLGARLRRYTIRAFLVGDDYPLRRDRLLEACGRPGPGELVHPHLGSFSAYCEAVSVGHSAEAGRVCELLLVFVRADVLRPLVTRGDTVGATSAAAGALVDGAEAGLVEVLSPDDLGASAEVQDAAAASWERVATERLDPLGLRGSFDKVAEWKDKLASLRSSGAEAVRAPSEFAARVRDLVETLPEAIGSTPDLFRILLGLARSEFNRPAPLLSGGLVTDLGDRAVSDLFAYAAAAEAVKAAVSLEWPTVDDANAARREFLALLEAMRANASDAVFPALYDLQAELVEAIPPPDRDLPRLGTVTLARSIPALVLSYRLFGRVDREADIVTRSRARSPLFLPAGPVPVVIDP